MPVPFLLIWVEMGMISRTATYFTWEKLFAADEMSVAGSPHCQGCSCQLCRRHAVSHVEQAWFKCLGKLVCERSGQTSQRCGGEKEEHALDYHLGHGVHAPPSQTPWTSHTVRTQPSTSIESLERVCNNALPPRLEGVGTDLS